MYMILLPQPAKLKAKGKYGYSLKKSTKERQTALNKSIKSQKRKPSNAALSKIRRLGLIRILQRRRNPQYCIILTNDMRYLDKKYRGGKGKIRNIC